MSSDVSVDVWWVTAMADPSSVCAMPNGSPGMVAPRVSCGSTTLPVVFAHAEPATGSLQDSENAGAFGPGAVVASSLPTFDQVSVALPRTGAKSRVPTTPLTVWSCRSVANAPMIVELRTYFVDCTGGAQI